MGTHTRSRTHNRAYYVLDGKGIIVITPVQRFAVSRNHRDARPDIFVFAALGSSYHIDGFRFDLADPES